ncbi:DUF1289 domain-containing protein [Alteromonas sp. ASW11-19]|uniref:DUF1289 domain-containing protein n=1 Tax=Alteromonas salexigens TaxID=2982530 RepID=A0ABT2VPN3_9ALTE|nr:DUF1289 domain-containing protein [Alteromonas salexigens]MCU7555273.1 DUF1289 domain-containing protein [Alteromonas salexigens]
MPLTEQSPCIGRCQLNERDVCTGCYRTIHDIIQWRSYSDLQRREAVARIEQCKSALNPPVFSHK